MFLHQAKRECATFFGQLGSESSRTDSSSQTGQGVEALVEHHGGVGVAFLKDEKTLERLHDPVKVRDDSFL